MIKKLPLIIYIFSCFISCTISEDNNGMISDKLEVDKALEMICPGAPPVMILRTSKEELRKALLIKQFSHQDTKNTVLKLADGTNIIIPNVRPQNIRSCVVRDLPQVTIPTSLGY